MKLLALVALAVFSVAPPLDGEDPTLRPNARAVLMVGIAGTEIDTATLFHLRDGGRSVILLGPNVSTGSALRSVAEGMTCATGGNYLLAVDHEPLRVQRLAPLIGSFPQFDGAVELQDSASDLGHDLQRRGVTMNLAPVLDLDGTSPALVGRTLGSVPDEVSVLGEAFRVGVEEARVAAVVKHFPGHGRAPEDPHRAVTTIDGPTDEELVPFRDAVEAGARAVMVGHPIYTELDPAVPASSSPATYDLLRSWGFEGVAVTDALGMVGARDGRTVAETSVAALAAGADLLIIEDPGQRERVVEAIVVAVQSGELDQSRLALAAHRVRGLASWTTGVHANCGNAWVRE